MNHTKWILQKKYPVNASGVTDGLSGDILASSRRNLIINEIYLTVTVFNFIAISCESYSAFLKCNTQITSLIGW